MRTAAERLVEYLRHYPSGGGGVGFSGAHGSGKTFLLTWLSDQARGMRTTRVQSLYAKVDKPAFEDIYAQFFNRLTRDHLAGIASLAISAEAKRSTGAAVATQETAQQIEATGDLTPAIASREVDHNELNISLRKALIERSSREGVASPVAAAIGLLDDPNFGESAFAWLSGKAANLPNEQLKTRLFEPGQTNAGETAVGALETLAALYRLAGIPLLVMIDEAETLLVQGDILNVSPALKMLIEQLSRQDALVLIAGTPAGWKRLPRDVAPRLLGRAPVEVGHLTVDETRALLDAYLPLTYGSEVPRIIREVAGGNPREILQTAYQAYAAAGSQIVGADEDLLRRAATASGTLADRSRIAAEIIDAAAAEARLESAPATWPGASVHDRLVTRAGGTALAIALVIASDRQAEARLGLEMASLKRRLDGGQSAGELTIVAVGYSSDAVRTLLAGIARVIVFEEATFAEELRQAFSALSAPVLSGSADATAEGLGDRLVALESRLVDLLAVREKADEAAAQRLMINTTAVAAPERRELEMRTRHELRDGLDQLSEALVSGPAADERQAIRRLLIANEANVKDKAFDVLGSLYLDALETVQIAQSRASPAEEDRETATVLTELVGVRGRLLQLLRRAVSGTAASLMDDWAVQGLTAAAAGVIVGGFAWPFLAELTRVELATGYYRTDFVRASPYAVGAFLIGALVSYVLITLARRPELRYRGISVRLSQLRLQLERALARAKQRASVAGWAGPGAPIPELPEAPPFERILLDMFEALYRPGGYRTVISLGAQIEGTPASMRADYWFYMAAAQGQRLKDTTDERGRSRVRKDVLRAAGRAVELDSSYRARLWSISDPAGFDNDLAALRTDPAFLALVGR